ncbi:MAG: AraC family transcriptional regulator [bacterium]
MDKSLFWLTRLCDRLRKDPLPVIFYVGPVGGYLHDRPSPALEIVFVLSGTLKDVQAGELKRDLGTNEAALISHHFGVQSARSAGANVWILLIDVTREPLFAPLKAKPLLHAFPVPHPDRLLAALRNVAAWSNQTAPHSWTVMTRAADLSLSMAASSRRSGPIHRKAALYELFAILMDEAQNVDAAPKVSTAVKTVIEFIIAHYGDPSLDLQALTQSAHICSSHLWRVFKKEVGMSPMRFLRDTRLRQGAALLETTSLRISEIAAKAGFRDPLYFSRMFVVVFKCNPMAYRKRQVALATAPARISCHVKTALRISRASPPVWPTPPRSRS